MRQRYLHNVNLLSQIEDSAEKFNKSYLESNQGLQIVENKQQFSSYMAQPPKTINSGEDVVIQPVQRKVVIKQRQPAKRPIKIPQVSKKADAQTFVGMSKWSENSDTDYFNDDFV